MDKLRYLKIWLLSFVFLAICLVFFLVAFLKGRLIFYVMTASFFLSFCICYMWSNKRITCKDGYSPVQAYLFYKKCVKRGVVSKPNKLNKVQKAIMVEVSKDYDFARDLSEDILKNTFSDGYEISLLIKSKINQLNEKI